MRWLVFGSHKGLGAELVAQILSLQGEHQVLAISRKDKSLYVSDQRYQFLSYDLTQEENHADILNVIKDFNPEKIIYSAGGGPYAEYGQKKWFDHHWAIKLNFVFPAKLCWFLSQQSMSSKFIYIGSQIAESEKGDPMGPSYAASKWAMKGLIFSLQQHYPNQFHIFSPGYMDTELLPKNAYPRVNGLEIKSPKEVAKEILNLVLI